MAKPRSIWNGWLSWGTVNVPVKLFSAAQSQSVRFNQLHRKDGARIKQKRMNPRTGEEVPYERIVRGYEVSANRWVVLSKDEAKAADGAAAKVIDIEEFVDASAIDPVFFDKPYFIGPQEGGEHAYAVVRKALEKSGRVGIGRFVLRSREQLVALRPYEDVLALSTMRFDDELVPPDKVKYDEAKKSPGSKEVDMAARLVESLAGKFDPEQYEDTYREAVLKLIQAKAEGKEIELPKIEEAEAPDDLMAALEASLSGSKK